MPVPLLLVVSQLVASELAVQLHPLPAVMLTLPLPDPDPTLALDNDSEYVQGRNACVIVKVCPATVMVPIRELALVFASIE